MVNFTDFTYNYTIVLVFLYKIMFLVDLVIFISCCVVFYCISKFFVYMEDKFMVFWLFFIKLENKQRIIYCRDSQLPPLEIKGF